MLKLKKIRGFTLIELLMVVAIISVLVAVALPQLRRFAYNAQRTEAILTLNAIHKGEMSYYSANDSFAWIGDVHGKIGLDLDSISTKHGWSITNYLGYGVLIPCAGGVMAPQSCGYRVALCKDLDGIPDICIYDDSFFLFYNSSEAENAGLPNDGIPFHYHDDITKQFYQ